MAEEGITGLVGSSVGEAAAFAAGLAIAPVLEPYLQELRNLTWSGAPTRPLDPDVPASAVAERAISEDTGADEASQTGLAVTPFKTLVETLKTAPGTGELLQMLRRGSISGDLFAHGLAKARLEDQWDTPIADLQHVRLAPAQAALAVVRSLMDSGGILVGENDVRGGVIAPTPISPLNPVTEAGDGGIDPERFRIMVNSIGLPMALQAAASAVFRGIIDKPDFYLAVAQGDTRPAWADAIFEQARQILTASQYVEGHLRGWIDEPWMYAGTAKHGMSPADTDLLFKISGRPITLHQITTGLARGGTYPSTYDDVPEPYRKSLEEGNIRPEWASLDYANRYSYPSGFQIRSEAQAGNLSEDDTRQVLLEVGWSPHWADHFAAAWTGGSGPVADPNVKSAQTSLRTAAHKSYVSGESDEATAKAALTAAGVPTGSQDAIITLWAHEAGLVRKQLTPAQIKKAWKNASTNAATDAPWTRDEAVLALVDLGYGVTDANSFLDL